MKYALCNGIILDGTLEMTPIKNKIILINDNKIEDIVEVVPNGYQSIDLHQQYILPGLINLHVHIPASGKPRKKPSDPVKLVKFMTSNPLNKWIMKKICASYVKTELMSGVTTIRSVGGILNVDTTLRKESEEGKIQAPRILAGNTGISVPGGHMADSLAYSVTSPKEAVACVEKIAQDHPDLLKLMITGGVLDATKKGEPGVLKMSPEIVKAACDKAHELGLVVAAHVESSEGVRVALLNGVDTIEHGAILDDEMVAMFKKRKVAHVATLSPALPYALFDRKISHASEMSQYNGKIVFEGIIECAKRCLKESIPVGLGTDVGCPYVTHYDMWRELCYFVKYCHVSPAFALHTATLINAQIAGIDKFTGSIEKGKEADLIVVEKNPLESLETLRDVKMVLTRGRMIAHPRVKKMKEVERELDKFL